MSERLPPFNTEAEEAVLGGLIIDPGAMVTVAPILEVRDFHDERNSWVYEAMLALHGKRTPIDFLTVCDALGPRLDIIGVYYLHQLMDAVPTSMHAEHYARIVERCSRRRKLIDAAGKVAALAWDDALDPDDAHSQAVKAVVDARGKRGDRMVPISKALSDYYDRIEAVAKSGSLGVPTGYEDLDKILRGMQKSDLILLAARPSVGKTSLSLCIALNAAKLGQRVGIFSLEMSTDQVVQRLLSIESAVSSTSMRSGEMADSEWPAFFRSMGRLTDLGIHIDDTPGLTPSALRSKAMLLDAKHGLDLLVVDYIQLMRSDGKERDRYQIVTAISQSLKALAKDLNLPVLALSQLNRECESRSDKIPMLSDLRDSGDLEQSADVVIFIYRDEYYNENTERKNVADVIVAKHRNGPTGKIALVFQKHLARFLSAEIRKTNLERGDWL